MPRSLSAPSYLLLGALGLLGLLGAPPRAIAAPARAPDMELVLSEEFLNAVLKSLTPIERTVQQDIGTGQALTIKVELSNPSVRVSNVAVRARFDYRVRDASGVIDLKGTAAPDMAVVAVPSKKVIEARFVNLGITLPGGGQLPIEANLDPIAIPGVWNTEVAFGDKVIAAEAVASEVVTESGALRVRAIVTLKPQASEPAREAATKEAPAKTAPAKPAPAKPTPAKSTPAKARAH